MNWLAKLFCRHQWEVRDQYNINSHGTRIGTLYVLQCKHCGDIKQKRVSI